MSLVPMTCLEPSSDTGWWQLTKEWEDPRLATCINPSQPAQQQGVKGAGLEPPCTGLQRPGWGTSSQWSAEARSHQREVPALLGLCVRALPGTSSHHMNFPTKAGCSCSSCSQQQSLSVEQITPAQPHPGLLSPLLPSSPRAPQAAICAPAAQPGWGEPLPPGGREKGRGCAASPRSLLLCQGCAGSRRSASHPASLAPSLPTGCKHKRNPMAASCHLTAAQAGATTGPWLLSPADHRREGYKRWWRLLGEGAAHSQAPLGPEARRAG